MRGREPLRKPGQSAPSFVGEGRPRFKKMLPCAGRVNSNMAPLGRFDLAVNVPSCASTIERQIDRPIPRPSAFVV